MDMIEIAMLGVYGFVVLNIVLFNISLAKKAGELPKEEIEFLLYRENKNLNFTLFSSVVATLLFYIFLSQMGFIIGFFIICILIGSYARLKKVLKFYLNQ